MSKIKVGSKVRFTGNCRDCNGKIGRVTQYTEGKYFPQIKVYLPASKCCIPACDLAVSIKDIILIDEVGKQLTFNFME